MKRLLVTSALLLAALPAQAISRYESMTMTCGEAQAVVDAEGAVILRYRSERDPSLPLYDRYVRHGGFCEATEYAATEFIPTADTRDCPVLMCRERSFEDRFFIR